MPECTLNFRAVCGCFAIIFANFMYKRVMAYRQCRVKTVTLGSMRLAVAVVFLVATLLHRAGDVEMNPGPVNHPKKDDGMRQTRLQTSSRSLSEDNTPPKKSNDEPSLSDIMSLLTGMKRDMSQRLDTLNEHFDTLNESVTGLREEVNQLTKELEDVRMENQQLKTDNRELTERVTATEKKIDDLEGRSKRNNLIFSGLNKETACDKENWEDCEKLIHNLLHDQLKIDDEIPIDRAHRLRDDSTSPIIVRFANFKDKQRVLKAKYKLKETEKGKRIFINEDFSKNVREIRKRLIPFLKEAKQDRSKLVSLVYDHLVINGRKYYYDHMTNNIKDTK